MKLTLSKVKKVFGHDDSLPFNAILLADGKRVAELFDDGWGGEVQIRWFDGKERKDVWDAIMELGRERYLKEHPEEGLVEANKWASTWGLSELSQMASDALIRRK